MSANDARHHETIGLVFDFDLTLSPGSVDTLLDVLEIDRDDWQSLAGQGCEQFYVGASDLEAFGYVEGGAGWPSPSRRVLGSVRNRRR